MYCRKCGTKLGDTDSRCPNCGADIPERNPAVKKEAAASQGSETAGEPPAMPQGAAHGPAGRSGKPGPGRFLIPFLLILLVAAGGGAVAGRFFPGAEKSGQTEDEEKRQEAENEEDGAEENERDGRGAAESGAEEDADVGENASAVALSDSETALQIAALNQEGTSELTIDVFEENYLPGARNISYAWDRTLFYTLEDVDPASAADGRINGYTISRKQLKNKATGNKMEYEIYTSPATGKVNKIVSIEYLPDYLEITDYYYDDQGKVSFIFVRKDINYIPSYAVPTKDGQRFYFKNDCLVKWRIITGGTGTNFVLGAAAAEGNNVGTVSLYDTLGESEKNNFDTAERRMINAAYNTYQIVLNSSGVSEISGYVYNENGPESQAQIVLYEETEAVFAASPDAEGRYSILVPSEPGEYSLHFAKDGCSPVELYEISISEAVITAYQEAVWLLPDSVQEEEITLQVFDALNYAPDGRGMARIPDARIAVRRGMNCRSGRTQAEVQADSYGDALLRLCPGMYTAEVRKNGYDTVYCNFVVMAGVTTVPINVSPQLAEGEIRIVLTWGAEPWDLDSHLFTPYDSSLGDSGYHIWYGNRGDLAGNNLDVDDTDGYGPETITIPEIKNGLYKYYVADFTNCSGNYPNSLEMSNSGATVNVYTSAGLTGTFHVPSNTPGVIWEVFEIRNGAIVPIQRYYSNIDDKSWWHNET